MTALLFPVSLSLCHNVTISGLEVETWRLAGGTAMGHYQTDDFEEVVSEEEEEAEFRGGVAGEAGLDS